MPQADSVVMTTKTHLKAVDLQHLWYARTENMIARSVLSYGDKHHEADKAQLHAHYAKQTRTVALCFPSKLWI